MVGEIENQTTGATKSRGMLSVIAVVVILITLAIAFLVLPKVKHNQDVADSKKEVTSGLASFKKGDFAKAISKLEKAVELDPKNAQAQRALGQSYEATGKIKEAAGAYRESLAADPKQHEVLYNLAIIYKFQNKPKQAIEGLVKAVKLNKQFVGARLILGDLYAQQNQKDKAKKQYQAVIKMKPFGLDVEMVKKKMDSLK